MITKGSQKVVNSPKVTTLAIALVANKTFWIMSCLVLVNQPNKLQGAHLHGLMDKFSTFFRPTSRILY
jgi:hypothetical protein